MATRHDGMGDSAMAQHHFRNITPTPRPLVDLSLRGDQGIRSSSQQFASFLHSMLDVREDDEALPDGLHWPSLGPGDRDTVHSSLPNLCSDPGSSPLAALGAHRPPVTRPRPGLCQSRVGLVTGARALSQALSRHPAVRAGSASDISAEIIEARSEDVSHDTQPLVTSPGLSYRASVRIMVRDTAPSLTQRPASRTGGEVRTQERPGGDKVAIVRPAMRLPRDLYDKMPSAPNTPGASRREPVSSVSKLASISPQPTKRVPKSVASMVRR